MTCHNPAVRVLGILISTFGCMGVGTNTHTSTHYGTSDKRWVNEALSYFGYPMFLGLSATYWWHKHVVLHHPAPNVVGVDSDADLLPWFAITADEVHASSGLRRFYYEHLQFWLFPLALAAERFQYPDGRVDAPYSDARRFQGAKVCALDRPRRPGPALCDLDRCAALILAAAGSCRILYSANHSAGLRHVRHPRAWTFSGRGAAYDR